MDDNGRFDLVEVLEVFQKHHLDEHPGACDAVGKVATIMLSLRGEERRVVRHALVDLLAVAERAAQAEMH